MNLKHFVDIRHWREAIIESTDLLEKQDYGTVENKIKDASQVGLVKDLGLDYFENPKERLEWIKKQAGAVSTGWKGIDQKLYGGLNRGEMTIFAGSKRVRACFYRTCSKLGTSRLQCCIYKFRVK